MHADFNPTAGVTPEDEAEAFEALAHAESAEAFTVPFETDAEKAALAAARPLRTRAPRSAVYHAVLASGEVLRAKSQGEFRTLLEGRQPEDVLFMCKGKELPKKVSVTF